MKYFLQFCVTLTFMLAVSASMDLANHNPMDYRSVSKSNRSSYAGCEKPGAGCSYNCRDRVNCVATGTGGFFEQYVSTCPSNQICIKGQCKKPPSNPSCSPIADLSFQCLTPGTFPDPGDCKVYHMCAPSPFDPTTITHTRVQCEGPYGDYGYNPKSHYCDKKLKNKQCSAYPIPLCKAAFDHAALAANPTIYYVCQPQQVDPNRPLVLFPHQYRCENGKKYDPKKSTCK